MTTTNGSNGAAIQSVQQTGPMVTIKTLFESRSGAIASVIPKHLGADRLIKVALNGIAKTPLLQQCTPSSLLQCLITSAELGLEPGGALGHAYLVPYKQTCTLIIGYRGLIDLMRRSGQLSSIRAVVVHAKDKFEVTEGLEQTVNHVPDLSDDPGALVAVYCVARLKDGSLHFERMTKRQVDAIRARSKSGNNGPWVTDYEEMAKKTVVRRAAKYLPLSSEVVKAFEVDNDDYVDGEVLNQASTQLAGQIVAPEETPAQKVKASVKRKLSSEMDAISPLPNDIPPPSDADFMPGDLQADAGQPL